MGAKIKNPKVQRYFAETLFLKTSTIKTIATIKFAISPRICKIFPNHNGIPNSETSKVMEKKVNKNPKTIKGKRIFSEIKSWVVISFFPNLKKIPDRKIDQELKYS